MAKISFSKTPLKRYYSYLEDGHIYDITTAKPEEVADNGGYWCCYFEVNPYYEVITEDGNKYYPIFEKIDNSYYQIQSSSFYTNKTYYYKINNTNEYVQITNFDKYYSQYGKNEYNVPNSASELPKVEYTYQNEKGVEVTETYYFDTLIKNGASYSNEKFTPMDVTKDDTKTTYGSIILQMVKDSVNINSFDTTVNALPVYLTGNDLTEEYQIESIEYIIPSNYLVIYGELFMEKLNEAMVNLGQSIVDKYKDSKDKTTYTDLTVESEISTISGLEGKITNKSIEL